MCLTNFAANSSLAIVALSIAVEAAEMMLSYIASILH